MFLKEHAKCGLLYDDVIVLYSEDAEKTTGHKLVTKTQKEVTALPYNPLISLVGGTGIEPVTSTV